MAPCPGFHLSHAYPYGIGLEGTNTNKTKTKKQRKFKAKVAKSVPQRTLGGKEMRNTCRDIHSGMLFCSIPVIIYREENNSFLPVCSPWRNVNMNMPSKRNALPSICCTSRRLNRGACRGFKRGDTSVHLYLRGLFASQVYFRLTAVLLSLPWPP